MRNLLNVIGPMGEDDVGEGMHLRVTHKGLVEMLPSALGKASMMNGNVQWDVRARTWTEAREGVR